MHYITCFVFIVVFAVIALIDRELSLGAPYLVLTLAVIFAIRNSYRAICGKNDSATGRGFHPHGNADAAFVLTTMVILLGVSLGLMVSLIHTPHLKGIDIYAWMLSPMLLYSLVYGIMMEFFLENKNRVCERAMDLERLLSLILTICLGIYSYAIYRDGDPLFNPIVITIAIVASIRLLGMMLFREISVTPGVKDDRSNLW